MSINCAICAMPLFGKFFDYISSTRAMRVWSSLLVSGRLVVGAGIIALGLNSTSSSVPELPVESGLVVSHELNEIAPGSTVGAVGISLIWRNEAGVNAARYTSPAPNSGVNTSYYTTGSPTTPVDNSPIALTECSGWRLRGGTLGLERNVVVNGVVTMVRYIFGIDEAGALQIDRVSGGLSTNGSSFVSPPSVKRVATFGAVNGAAIAV